MRACCSQPRVSAPTSGSLAPLHSYAQPTDGTSRHAISYSCAATPAACNTWLLQLQLPAKSAQQQTLYTASTGVCEAFTPASAPDEPQQLPMHSHPDLPDSAKLSEQLVHLQAKERLMVQFRVSLNSTRSTAAHSYTCSSYNAAVGAMCGCLAALYSSLGAASW